MRCRWGVALAIGLIPAAAEAGPSPPATAALNWTRLPGAESCIGMRELAAAVEKRIGRPLFGSATQAEVLVEGNIERTSNPRGWRAQIRLSGADAVILGTRDIQNTDESCRALDQSLALAIALMIAAPPRQPPSPERIRVITAAGTMLGWGFLPGFGAGIFSRVAFERDDSPGLEIDARLWPLQTTAFTQTGPVGSFWSVQGGISVCPLQGGNRATLVTGCLGTAVAALRATFPDLESSTGFRIDLTTQGRLSRRIVGPLFVDVGFSVAFPIGQPAFYERRKIPPSYVAGSADVGISIRLP